MKALTLWQPWATLVAIGAKWIETRDWSTDYRGNLAIHAAARKQEPASRAIHEALLVGCYLSGYPLYSKPHLLKALPLGGVVAVARLERCVPTDAITSGLYRPEGFDERQLEYGNFAPGRWAWILDSITVPGEPILAKGAQKLWDWEPPASATWRPVERLRPAGGAR